MCEGNRVEMWLRGRGGKRKLTGWERDAQVRGKRRMAVE